MVFTETPFVFRIPSILEVVFLRGLWVMYVLANVAALVATSSSLVVLHAPSFLRAVLKHVYQTQKFHTL